MEKVMKYYYYYYYYYYYVTAGRQRPHVAEL
jgi:hypothetical protein